MVTHWVSVVLAVSRRQTGVRQRISGIHLRQGYGGQDAGNTHSDTRFAKSSIPSELLVNG